eukprot:jgi/Tetstr1/430196/TSEL_020027.t1
MSTRTLTPVTSVSPTSQTTCLAWLSRPVDMLEDYLRVFRPPSGSRLLAAPKSSRIGPQAFHSTPYSGFNSAFKAAYARAFPDPATRTTPLDRVGSHSGRKSLAQWLWDRYSQNFQYLPPTRSGECSGVFTDTAVSQWQNFSHTPM